MAILANCQIRQWQFLANKIIFKKVLDISRN